MSLPRTLIHALHDQAARHADRPALWTLRGGCYLPVSWREYAERVKRFALGLHALGFGQGDTLAILGFNREEWVVADLAAIALGGVPVGLYTTSSPEQVEYVAGHCEAKILVVENAGYLATVQALRAKLPKLRHVVVMEELPGAQGEGAVSYAQVLESGQGRDESPYWRSVNALEPSALATLIYTSGTTGNPKGVMLTHLNLVWTASRLMTAAELDEGEVLLSYLPLSHIAEQLATLHCSLLAGFQVYFAQSLEKLPVNLKQVRPTLFFGVPRVWEKFKAKAEEGLARLGPAKGRLVRWARGAAKERHARVLAGQPVPPRLELQYQAAQRLVFGPLKARIGLDRGKVFVTSAAPISKDVLDFFASIDVVIREIYGQSEVTGPTSVNTVACTRLGTLGRPLLGVEVRIAGDGEILVRGPNVCAGYYKEPQATAELLVDGWLHSGDVGELDPEGFLRVTGRKKEIIVTSGGKKTAPANIEVMLKQISPVGNALVVGERRKYLVALLPLDPERAAALAKEKGWPQDLEELARTPQLHEYLEARIEAEVNPRLARFEAIKKFRVLPHDFTIEGGELTPTLKMRRTIAEQKHSRLVAEMYGEEEKAQLQESFASVKKTVDA